jgi:arsenite methyltransferase
MAMARATCTYISGKGLKDQYVRLQTILYVRSGATMVIVDTEELAKGYIAVNNTQFDAGLFLLKRLGIVPGNRVLDVGCGPGNLTAHIAEIVGKDGTVVGIDPSKERIALALELKKVTPNLSFYEGKAEHLSQFPSASIDVVFVNSTFHWVQDQPAALAEFARVLKSGGRLGISGGSGDFVAAHEKIKADVLSREPYSRYPEKSGPIFLKRGELESLLDRAGFSKREIVVNTIIKSAKDGAAMIEWLDTSSSGATYGGIPLDLRPKAREEMKVEWGKITTEEGIRMEMELLVTVAVKN